MEHLGLVGNWLERAEPFAMATLVRTRGASPRLEGARLLVAPSGDMAGSVTLGGCVDGAAVRAARDVLNGADPILLDLELGGEEALLIGLSCIGSIDVLVEAMAPGSEAREVLHSAVAQAAEGSRTVRAVGVHGGGSIAISKDRILAGDPARLGGDELVRCARELIDSGSHSEMMEASEGESIFLDLIAPRPRLVIVGASDVAVNLSALATTVGFSVHVVDSRPLFATRQRFPAAELHVGIPSEVVSGLNLARNDFLVLLAHDHKFEVPVLERALQSSPISYVGMLGSRRRAGAVAELLRGRGVPQSAIERLHVPVGLDLGGETAAEIAVSILAEIVAERAG